jgi:biotin carboxyl carrier protein
LTKYTVSVDGDLFEIEVGSRGRVWVNQMPCEVDLRHVGGNGEYSLLVNNHSYEVHVVESRNVEQRVSVGGRPYRARIQRGHRVAGGHTSNGAHEAAPSREALTVSSRFEIRAPLPGLLVEMRVRDGELVQERGVVAVLESMKMNLELRSPRCGLVQEILVPPGQRIAQDDVLVIIDPRVAPCGKNSQ